MLSTATPVAFSKDASESSRDRFGDYYSNEAPQEGTVPPNSRLIPGSLWRVVAASLNCRSAAGISYPIVSKFSKGDILQAEVGRGGSDEVLLNSKDSKGKPWMRVRGKEGDNTSTSKNCYVRANSSYIKPL